MNDSQQSNTPLVATTSSQNLADALNRSRRALEPAGVPSEGWSPKPRKVPVLPPYPSDLHPARPHDLAAGYPHSGRVSRIASLAVPASASRHAVTTAPVPATVLIVEHEFNNRMLMEKILDLGGYRCLSASNGHEALVLFDRERPDLVLTDISMPVMDGLTATAALRSRPNGQHVPIIAVSGHALREDREHALRHGCTAYLVKPYRPHDLLGLVAQLLTANIKEGSV